MRHSVLRTFSTVLLFFVFCLPASFLGQAQNSKKPSSNKRAVKETTLKADEGPWVKVKTPIRKDRRIPLAAGEQGQGDGKPAEMPAFRVLSHPREDRLMQGHSFDHDLRTLPHLARIVGA